MKKIRVCLRAIPSDLSKGIQRVARALEHYKPDWAEIVLQPKQSDIWVLHVIGHGSMEEFKDVTDRGVQVAMIQYCLRTTEDPKPAAWLPYWTRAKAVWSYYDLAGYVAENGTMAQSIIFGEEVASKFMHQRLGVDAAVFRPSAPLRKTYLIGTSGTIADTESVGECNRAAKALNKRQLHLGPQMPFPDGAAVHFFQNVTDIELADFWSQCSFVAGLRRIEGFELPAIEGLMCGARPILYNKPHYRDWFGEYAEYIEEGSQDEVTESLIRVMGSRIRPVTEQERKNAAATFDWGVIAAEFWERLR